MAEETEDASGLRKQLAELGGQNKSMAAELAQYKAGDVIATEGLMYVTPEDLTNVSLDELEEKAKQLESERATVFGNAVRRSLQAQGVTGDDLDNQVQSFLAGQQPASTGPVDSETVNAFTRARSIGAGGAAPNRNPESMSTMEKLHAGLSS